jgi:3-hydroxybutyryl-CoA dehydrogenase
MGMENVSHIGIIGTGMIATSLAVLTTGHGYKTTVLARSPHREASCKDSALAFYKEISDHNLMTQAQIDICIGHLDFALTYDEMTDVDVFFECVTEAAEIKQSVHQEIESHCPNVRAICSVSSAIVVDDLVKNTRRYKDRIIVTHPFNPPHMVPFFELATGSDTAEGVVELAAELLKTMGREPVILKKGAPGFIGNRLQYALWREALHLVESGIADPQDIDTCLKYSFCPRYTSIGLFEHFDNGGMHLAQNVSKMLFPELCDTKEVMKSVSDKIEAGDLGRKTGKGFYDWSGVDGDAYNERVNAPYWRFFNWDFPTE